MAVSFNQIPSPCYVLDEQALRNNLQAIDRVKQESGCDIIPAFKSFAMWKAFPIIQEYIDGAAASSLHEARLAVEEMKVPAFSYSPAFHEADFPGILHYSNHVTFNSLNQFNKFVSFTKQASHPVSMGIRVNPEYSAVSTDIYNPCSPGSRLGILASQMPDTLPEEIEGLHLHALCESNSFALDHLLNIFEDKFEKWIPQVKWINLGGGHLITDINYDRDHLIRLLKSFKNRHPHVRVILEPGSAFVWGAGYLVSTILDITENHDIKTAILDVSFTAHMPDTLEMPYKPDIIGATEPMPGKPVYRLGGNSCLAGDFKGDWSFERELQIGDRIIFKSMMEYTMVKTTFFNGIKHPSIGLWDKNDQFILYRSFDYDDFKNRLS